MSSNNDSPATSSDRFMWRGLDELHLGARTLADEFPPNAAQWSDPVTRRQFLTLMGASAALAGMGCSASPAPHGKIMPYVRQPEQLTPGMPLYYATAMTLGGYATGVLAESHEGRPTKIEGNPNHPASVGASDLFTQASVLDLYDPDRSATPTYQGRPRTWSDAITALRSALEGQRSAKGSGLRLVSEPITSPTLAAQVARLLQAFPEATWHQYEPAGSIADLAGASLLFGEHLQPIYHFDQADVILSLDADFLWSGPGHLRYSRDFSRRRSATAQDDQLDQPRFNRLYVTESMTSITGAAADHRLRTRSADVDRLARAIAAMLGLADLVAGRLITDDEKKWVTGVVGDLRAHRGTSVVVPGKDQPPAVHALAHAMNFALGNIGKTVDFIAPPIVQPTEPMAALRGLVDDMKAKRVAILIILGVNPVFTAPVDLEFSKYLVGVPLRVHWGLYQDETASVCQWHINATHYLEEWGDARAFDGTAGIVQPLIAPLYQGKSALEFVSALANPTEGDAHEMVRATWREHWQQRGASGDFDSFWQTALHDGVVPDSAATAKVVQPKANWAQSLPTPTPEFGDNELELLFRPDPTVYDGRFANNGWLQELPKPITKITWGNAVFLSPATAKAFGFRNPLPGSNGGERGQAEVDLVELEWEGRKLTAPAVVLPGHADGSLTIHLGHGRQSAGRVGTNVGVNAYTLRVARNTAFVRGAHIHKTGATTTLAMMQMHRRMESRDLIQRFTLQQWQARARLEQAGVSPQSHHDPRMIPLTLYPSNEPAGPETDNELYPKWQHPDPRQMHRWAMCIDQSACIGCQACVIACQAENNIPVVGKTEVERGREMHWLRVDEYYEGDENNPTTYHQPVPCMQCENAPCEVVCPVGATVHSHDGLNDMVYNRCVGTRYCSNNCPYKVRRFNFFFYADYATESLKLQRNPEVSVRSRGVMEKCTYCVQRIRAADIAAEREGRPIRDGEIQTACQQACPTQAIAFGDLNVPDAQVNHWKTSKRNYNLLDELNTRPRTTYLAVIRNPNPEMT